MLHTFRRSLSVAALGWGVAIAALPAAGQNQAWIRQFGSPGEDQTQAAAPDGSGGVYITGYTTGSLGGPNAGGDDAWLARYDGTGTQLWIRQLGTSQLDHGQAVASDGSGGVYVCGWTVGSLGGPNAGGGDAWLARYDGTGTQLWIRQFGSSSWDEAWAAAPDGSGGVYIVGGTTGSLGGPNAGDNDAWIARFDSAGNQVWIRQFGSSFFDESFAAAPDGSGGVYVGGSSDGNLGGPNAGGSDVWLARFDSAGNQIWIRQFGSVADDAVFAASPDGSGGVYICGDTYGSLGGPNAGYYDAWLARYDSSGNQLWLRQLGSSSYDEADDTAPDGLGGVYVTGDTWGDLGGPNAGRLDAWFAHYDGSGIQLWIRQFGTSEDEGPLSAAPDGSGGVHVTGSTGGSLGGPNAGGVDVWLARVGSSIGLLCEPGVGSVIPCPCSNAPMGRGHGCDNSAATGGATIHALGADSLAIDTLAFVASGEKPTALSLLLQGTTALSSGAVYGQGVRCVAGTLKRLFNRNASAGSVTLPDSAAGDPTISARSAALGNPILAGQSRFYLVYYRDPVVLGGCPASSTFNSGPTMRADWGP